MVQHLILSDAKTNLRPRFNFVPRYDIHRFSLLDAYGNAYQKTEVILSGM